MPLRAIGDLSIGTIDAVRQRMRRVAIVLLLVITACVRPSQTRSHGYVAGGLLVAAGAGLIGLAAVGHCQRDDGLFNNCDGAEAVGITLGALIAAAGLAKLAVQLTAPTPPPPAVLAAAPPVPAARQEEDRQPGPEPSEAAQGAAIGLFP